MRKNYGIASEYIPSAWSASTVASSPRKSSKGLSAEDEAAGYSGTMPCS